MQKFAFLIFLIPILLIAGCTQTGQLINVHPDIEVENITENITKTSQNITEIENIENKQDTQNFTQTNVSQNSTQNPDLCQNITCAPNQRVCPDGFVVSCTNTCNPATGMCSNCSPSCAGHEQPACELVCGTCQQLDNQSCSCQPVQPCCGNGLCESAENYENCQADCPQPQNIYISEIMYNPVQDDNYNEWIEIYNPGPAQIDLNGWMLCDKALLSGYVARSQIVLNDSGYILAPAQHAIITDGDTGTEVYDNFNVSHSLALHVSTASMCDKGLSNTMNETITLKDSNGNVIDSLTYDPKWAGEGMTITKVDSQWTESEPSPGS